MLTLNPRSFALAVAWICTTLTALGMNDSLIYIGTYTRTTSQGIYALRLNPATGELSTPELVATTANPSFIALSPDKAHLYAVCESGTLAVPFAVNLTTGNVWFYDPATGGFDIDLSKCMCCGFCVEACPVDARAPGDNELTHAIRFTKEFEGCIDDISALTFRYIVPGNPVVVAKNKKGQVHPTPVRGQRAREARQLAARFNPATVRANRARLDADPLLRRKPDLEQAFQLPVVAPAPKAKKE